MSKKKWELSMFIMEEMIQGRGKTEKETRHRSSQVPLYA